MARKNQDPIEKIIEQAAASVAGHIAASHSWQRGTESPIEQVFLTALCATAEYIYPLERDSVRIAKHPDALPEQDDIYSFVVKPQQKLLSYRVDFMIYAYDFHNTEWGRDLGDVVYDARHWRCLVVECDGHDFHERTKEQAARDRKRDRDLSLKGYDVFRFTGSELWRDPVKCAKDVIQWARFMP